MSGITISKTWQFSLVAVGLQGSLLAQNQDMLLRIKNAMVGFGTLPWTVKGSSNSVAGAMDNTDRWVSAANLVWANAGSAHSWIVLAQTGIGAGFQLLLSLEPASATGVTISVWYSPSAGFTGGSATARPSAADEVQLYSAQTWSYGTSAAAQNLMVMQSTDGQCTRVVIFKGAVGPAVWILDKVQGVPATLSSWSPPFFAWILGTSGGDSNAATLSNTAQVATGKLLASAGIVASVFMGCEGLNQLIPQGITIANEASSEFPLAPIFLASETAGARGRWGFLADCWLGSNATVVTGDVYPSGVSRTLLQTGMLVVPWNGSVPPTGGTARDGDTFQGVSNVTQLGLNPYPVVAGSMQILGVLPQVRQNVEP